MGSIKDQDKSTNATISVNPDEGFITNHPLHDATSDNSHSGEEGCGDAHNQSDINSENENLTYYPNIRRSSRISHLPDRCTANILLSNQSGGDWDPSTVLEALNCPDPAEKQTAIHEKFNMITKRSTWKTAFLPLGAPFIKNIWIFQTKRHLDGDFLEYQARLIAKKY